MATDELKISNAEHRSRIEKIQKQLRRKRLDALYLTNSTRILYTTGFSHITTERPLAAVIPDEGLPFFMAPWLERDHIRQECSLAGDVMTYPDYPGKIHPMRLFAKFMGEKGLASSRIATDSLEGAAGGYGYRGPALRDLMRRAKFVAGRDIVDNMRLIKSRQEIRLLRESAKWSELAHKILLENTRVGLHDTLVSVKSSYDALARMLKKLGQSYVQLKIALSPVVVGFRGQVGGNSAIPHAVYSKKKIRSGDVLVTEAGVEVGGYTSELERTVIVGKPSSRATRCFEAMLKAQNAALKEFRLGIACSRVDEAASRSLEESGLKEGLRHHTGHGIGLEGHEPPWLDSGDRTVIREGMVFSTHYPRGLEDLTV